MPDSPESGVEKVPEPLFEGDSGQLPLETRRVLVQLLAGPSLDGRRHSLLWPVLLRDESAIASRLSDLFLTLVIDRDLKVAFTRQADAGELEVPALLRRAPLTFVDSVILLYLRQQLMRAESRGERAVVSSAEIIDGLAAYERSASTDHAGFVKRIAASIEKIKKYSILQKMRASDDRYEVSPTLKLLFSSEQVAALTARYRALAEQGAPLPDVAADDAEDPADAVGTSSEGA